MGAFSHGGLNKLDQSQLSACVKAIEIVRAKGRRGYEKRQTSEHSVEQGREYVDAYVQFTHFAEEADHLAGAGAGH
ncbi:MAG: DUF6448 family protein [Paracoccaceae bacterium]